MFILEEHFFEVFITDGNILQTIDDKQMNTYLKFHTYEGSYVCGHM